MSNEKKLTMGAVVRILLCITLIMTMLTPSTLTLAAQETTGRSYNSVSSKVNSTINSAKGRINQLYDLDTALLESYFAEVEVKLAELRTATGDTTALEAEIDEICNKITMASAESKVVSARATWHRPSESTYKGIESTVKTFVNCGMNLVFVESFYHGCTIYKSDDIDVPYHPTLATAYTDTEKGIVYDDYLSAFLACCEEYGIEVHAWVENFYVGVDSNMGIIKARPEWMMYNDDGSVLQRKEGGSYIFIDPANPEVQDFLIDFYKDMLEKNPALRGLNLDYIRYPVSDRSYDTGYTISAMMGFYETLGKEFSETQLSDRTKMANKFKQLFDSNYLFGGQAEADANYQKWVEYRTGIITDFVKRVKNEVKSNSSIVLSTAVFANISESLNSKKADWQLWYNNGWIDIATPMAYYSTAASVQTNVKNMIAKGGNNCLYYTGLACSYSGYPAWYNKEFIEASYNAGASGYVIFASQQIIGHPDVQLALSSGVGRKAGVLPHADIGEILDASFDDILDKADRLYIPAGGMTAEQRSNLEAVFKDILNKPHGSAEEIKAVYASINTLRIVLSSFADGHSYDRMYQQIGELMTILDARHSMKIFAEENAEVPEVPEEPETPEDPETPDEPDDPDNSEDEPLDTPKAPEEKEPEVKLNFFQRLWRAIRDFFRRLFGKK